MIISSTKWRKRSAFSYLANLATGVTVPPFMLPLRASSSGAQDAPSMLARYGAERAVPPISSSSVGATSAMLATCGRTCPAAIPKDNASLF